MRWASAKTRPFWFCCGVCAMLILIGAYLKSTRVHARDVQGSFVDDCYVVRFTLVNPTDQDADLVAVVRLMTASESDDGSDPTTLATSELQTSVPAGKMRSHEVKFDDSSGNHWVVRPDVTLKSSRRDETR